MKTNSTKNRSSKAQANHGHQSTDQVTTIQDNRPIAAVQRRLANVIQRVTKDDWLRRAKALHKTCHLQQKADNGGGRLSGAETASLNQLQHDIGSHHGRRRVTYNEARESLDQMFDWVKGGTKDSKFSSN